MRAITLAEANKIIGGTFASARKRKAHALAAIVLDAGGRVKAFQKQDGASLLPLDPRERGGIGEPASHLPCPGPILGGKVVASGGGIGGPGCRPVNHAAGMN